MRGQRSLFGDILKAEKPVHKTTVGSLTRNHKLVHRYYYYAQLQPQRLDYEYIIENLSQEFDLSHHRAIVVLNDNHALLKQLITDKLTKKQLTEKYPYLVWR